MSHTDKTRPHWVQIHDRHNRGWLREVHDHRNGVCDIEQAYLEPWDRCCWGRAQWFQFSCSTVESSYAYHTNKLWPRQPSRGGWSRPVRDGKARMQWRRLRQELLHNSAILAGEEWWCWEVDYTADLPRQPWLNHKWD